MHACILCLLASICIYMCVCMDVLKSSRYKASAVRTRTHARTHASTHTHTHTPVEQGPEELAVQGIGSEVALLRIIPPREKKWDLLPPPAQLPVTKETKSRESIGQDRSGHVLRRASLVMRHLKGVHGPPVHHLCKCACV